MSTRKQREWKAGQKCSPIRPRGEDDMLEPLLHDLRRRLKTRSPQNDRLKGEAVEILQTLRYAPQTKFCKQKAVRELKRLLWQPSQKWSADQ